MTDCHDTAVTAAPLAGKANTFMEVILYGQQQGWNSSKVECVGHKGLIERAIRARRYNSNIEDDAADAVIAERQQLSGAQPTLGAIANIHTSEELHSMLEEARRSFHGAEEKMSEGLVNCEDWMGLRDCFYGAGALFAIVGCPDEAARSLLNATLINRAFHDDDEALASLTVCVESLKISHPVIAAESLQRLSVCYAKNNSLFQAARCCKEAAEIHDTRLDNKEEAIDLYEQAINFYNKVSKYGMERSLSDACFERMNFLHTELAHWHEAELLFLKKARMTPSHLPSTGYYMYATLAVLARGSDSEDNFFDSIYDTKKKFEALQEENQGFQKGKENKLLRKLLQACDENSLNNFDLAVMEYNSYVTTLPNAAFDLIMAQCRQNLFEHLERYD